MIKRLVQKGAPIFVLCLLFYSCAKIVSPNGGPKDSTAPTIAIASPPPAQLNFSGNEFEISFDENIRLDNADGIIISPFMKERPEIKIRKNKLHFKFKETLRENTTYTVKFGNSVRDLNEGNQLEGLEYYFSTGAQIDSLALSGKVINAESLKPETDIMVGLYEGDSIALFTEKAPLYVSRTDKQGNWKISNIPAKRFSIVALKDQDYNFYYSQPIEDFAFLNGTITPGDTSLSTINMYLSVKADSLVRLESRESIRTGVDHIVLDSYVDSLFIESIDESSSMPTLLMEKDSILLFYDSPEVETSFLLLSKNGLVDSLTLRPYEADSICQNGWSLQVPKERGYHWLGLDDKPMLRFDYPLEVANYEFELRRDSVLLNDSFQQVAQWKGEGRNWFIDYPWESGMNYSAQLLPRDVRDIRGCELTDTISTLFYLRNEPDYGTLNCQLSDRSEETSYYYSLIDSKGNEIEKAVLQADSIFFPRLLPAKLSIRIIEDQNNNGQWDPADFEARTQAERVYGNTTDIVIRPNWETVIDLSLDRD